MDYSNIREQKINYLNLISKRLKIVIFSIAPNFLFALDYLEKITYNNYNFRKYKWKFDETAQNNEKNNF